VTWVVNQFRWRRNEELELLTTVDFAALDLNRAGKSVTLDAIKQVIAANPEWKPKLKRNVFSDSNIASALEELRTLFPVAYTA
jgi:type I restriction enzyme S subunit